MNAAMSRHDLSGKVILVTGGARGLGAASTRAFVDAGAKVVVLDIDEAVGGDLPPATLENITFCHHDVADPVAWRRVVDHTLDRHGRIDGLLNNAAIFATGDIASTGPDMMDRFYRVNQLGVFLGMQAVLEPMRKAGGGVIVNMASAAARRGVPGMIAYASSKWAVRGMTRCAAVEFAPFGIRVNSVTPGQIETRMLETHSDDVKAKILGMIPLGHFGKPDDVGSLMRFLMSDDASYITGADMTIDGAMLA